MIFKQIDEILNGTKTQTRRVVKPGEIPVWGQGKIYAVEKNGRRLHTVGASRAIVPKRGQPGLKTHRIKLLSIRQECLQDISYQDALAEGLIHQNAYEAPEPGFWSPEYIYDNDGNYVHHLKAGIREMHEVRGAISGYRLLWESINAEKPYRWVDNPLVWVYEFEAVQS